MEANRALELDPMSPNTRQNRLFILCLARRYDEAAEEVMATLEMDPAYTALYYYLGLVYGLQRDYRRAIEAFGKVSSMAQSRGTTVLAATGWVYARAGRWQEARDVLTRLEGLGAAEYVSAYDLALVHLALGDRDRALAGLSKACDDYSSFVPFLKVDPRLDDVRTDPRFDALVQRLGLSDER